MNGIMALAELPATAPGVVHWRHYLDGWPLCWPQTQTGQFKATDQEADVTCRKCIGYLSTQPGER